MALYRNILPLLRYCQYTALRYTTSARMEKPVESSIRKKLTDTFQPAVLDVINESNMHSVPKGSETHFKVVVVTDKFESLPLIKRHRLINDTLQEELQTGVHALSIIAKTPKQWEDSGGQVSKSPPCQGGAGL
ncbi:DNA-binding transcriptional regulator BolA-like [Ruditapes philippinarum]|uniref:DNA-binding transcriptional regulator BolA-like n=1 Tax=Ruditapes philippinarum TaxID=129788 RepID=UPI00295B5447|nr:DNA-binding transcriptional regulator BolA-like [Ruditapes philippinarum]